MEGMNPASPAEQSRTRLTPDARRAQLLDLGISLFARRPIEEISIDEVAEAAGISRGLLYHYFGGKRGFRLAVVRQAAEEFVASTAPPPIADPMERLAASIGVYLDYVEDNPEGYFSLVRAAVAGDPQMRSVYVDARAALADRVMDLGVLDQLGDPVSARLLVRGWLSMAEEIVLAWQEPDSGVDKDQVKALLVGTVAQLLP